MGRKEDNIMDREDKSLLRRARIYILVRDIFNIVMMVVMLLGSIFLAAFIVVMLVRVLDGQVL